MDFHREIWEGWTPQDFIDELEVEIRTIMMNKSWIKPFKKVTELTEYIRENQPYYKKSIPEVNEHFIKKYSKQLYDDRQ